MSLRIKNFFSEIRQELHHVNWPTRAEALRLSAVVIVIAVGISAFLGVFDYAFSYILRNFIVN
jgi:preprotein translocase SecE subunit